VSRRGVVIGLGSGGQGGGQVQHPAGLHRIIIIQPAGQALGCGYRSLVLRGPVQAYLGPK
jgi:hypothetical protein